ASCWNRSLATRSRTATRRSRRTAQTWLEAGVHIKAVSDLLGHSSISITGDIYGHTSDDTARAAMDALASPGHLKPNLTVVSDPDETITAASS
ncbi:hypothetical protein ABQE58_26015, partial [Mycolicibacterium elephantis]